MLSSVPFHAVQAPRGLLRRYMYEIQRLDEERKSLKLEKEKLTEAFETKLWRAQTLYDTELNAAKSLYSNELDALKEHEAALRDELLGRYVVLLSLLPSKAVTTVLVLAKKSSKIAWKSCSCICSKAKRS